MGVDGGARKNLRGLADDAASGRGGAADAAAEDAPRAVAVSAPGVLHVNVEDALGEGADELDVIDALVAEVGVVVVEAEALVAFDGLDGALGGGGVEGDLGRV